MATHNAKCFISMILWPTSKLPSLYKNKVLEPKVFSPFSNVCYNGFNNIMQHCKKMLHNSFCVLGHSVCSNRFTSTEENFHKFSLLWSYLTFKNYLKWQFSFFSQIFCDDGLSNYIVVYLRLLTSAQLQRKSDFFQNFIEGERSIKEFCSQVHIFPAYYYRY